jgi:outer membrane protein TolC/ABC-type uncharacterized transport system substrate-binding protein
MFTLHAEEYSVKNGLVFLRKKPLLIIVAGLVIVVGLFSPSHASDPDVITIGIVVDGPWERNDIILDMTKQEVQALTEGEFNIQFLQDKMIVADWTNPGVNDAIDRLLNDSEVDMVLAFGVLASDNACRREWLPKPIVAPFVIDIELQGVPFKDGASGVENLHYLTFPSVVDRDMRYFLEIVQFKKLVFLVNKPFHDGIPHLTMRTRQIMEDLGIEPYIIPVGRTIDEAFAAFPPDAEAVYVASLVHLAPGEFDRLVEGLIERKLPSYSLLGLNEVERGLLATANPDIFPRYTRRIALSVHRILLGEDPAAILVTMPAEERLTINMATARAIGVYPRWSIVTEANLINETREAIERVVDLNGAVREALTVNFDLAARERFVKAGEKDVTIARSNLFPQIDLSVLGMQIDKDRAEASFGQQAEQSVSGSVNMTQVIYSEPVWANYSIQKNLQKTRESEMDQLRLDIAQSAATAYLNVLRTKTFERIQKQNLNLTRSNLELARIRESIGTARAAEVLRWESELASNRKDVISSSAQRNVSEILLNRILRRPAEEPFETREADLEDPHLLLSQGRLMQYADNLWDFKILRSFMVEEALAYSPEIQGIDAAIAAQERAGRSASRAFWQPTVALQAKVSNMFVREGAGSDPVSISLPPSMSELFTRPDDIDWSIGLSASFPLFNGGEKYAKRSQVVEKLAQLRFEREAVTDRIEQRVRSALQLAGASYAGIEQARLAADAADQSLDLMIDAYSQGAATIIDLIDAQNAALVAGEVAANAVYDFLIDLMEVERSIGKVALQMSDEEREAFFTRIEDFFETYGNP